MRIVRGIAFPIMGKNEVLMQFHRKRNMWTIPMGTIEEGETPHAAVIREAREELGIVVTQMLPIRFGLQDIMMFPECNNESHLVVQNIIAIINWDNPIKNMESHKHSALAFQRYKTVLNCCHGGSRFYSLVTAQFLHEFERMSTDEKKLIMGLPR